MLLAGGGSSSAANTLFWMGTGARSLRSRRSVSRERLSDSLGDHDQEITMRNLRRRIEALERSNSANLGRYQAIAERAMGCLQPDDVESLLAAYGVECAGRTLT